MPDQSPPQIFAKRRRLAVRRRMLTSQNAEETPSYLIEDMTEDVIERLSFLRLDPVRALVIGDYSGKLADALRSRDCTVVEAEPALGFDEEAPLPQSGFDLVASLGTLDTVNDLPGALIHIRNALAPGGLMIASFCGAGCVPKLREAMLAADDERPSPRIHPMVDVRAGGQLLQRAGFADPVIDSRHMDVSFPSLDRLVGDLRAQGLSNVLADSGPQLSRDALERARKAFVHAGDSGRTIERFEVLTLSGWRR